MASIKFRLRSEANKNVAIKVRIILGRGKQDLELNTGFTINPKDWNTPDKENPKKGDNFPKQNNPENKVLFNNLKKLESFLFKSVNTDLGESVVIDTFWLEAKINDCFKRVVKNDKGLLINHTQYIIDNASTRTIGNNTGLSKETIKSYVSFKKVVLEYQLTIKKQIQFIDLTAPFIEKFKIWMLTKKKYAKNTAGRKLQMLKTICIDAEKHEIPVTPYSKIIQHFERATKTDTFKLYRLPNWNKLKMWICPMRKNSKNLKPQTPNLQKAFQ